VSWRFARPAGAFAAEPPLVEGGKRRPSSPGTPWPATARHHSSATIATSATAPPSPTAEVKDVRLLRAGDEVVVTTVSGAKTAARVLPHSWGYFHSALSDTTRLMVCAAEPTAHADGTMQDRATESRIAERLRDAPAVVWSGEETVARVHSRCWAGTWETSRGAMAAIRVEKGILNVMCS